MADGHLGPGLNVQWWTFEASDDTWSQKSTLVYTLNSELMHGLIITNVQIHRFAKVTIYLGFAFLLTIFDIFMFIINYQFDQ